MGKSFHEGRAKGTSHWDNSGYGYDSRRQGNKGFRVIDRQKHKREKMSARQSVYDERERVVE